MTIVSKQSLINRTGITLAVIILLATLNMVFSFLTAESAENDPIRINMAGTLRIQSYRIAEALIIQNNPDLNPDMQNLLPAAIQNFEQHFYAPILFNYLNNSQDTKMADAANNLEINWLTLKENLEHDTKNTKGLLQQIDSFVINIDHLIKILELQIEQKFRLLRLIQGVSLLMTCLIIAVSLFDISQNIIAPLRQLFLMANKVQQGDFSMRVIPKGDAELSMLAETFNKMAESLDYMYKDLEEKVTEKTLHLEQTKDDLALLYNTSQLLNSEGSATEKIEYILFDVRKYFSATKIIVSLTEDGDHAFQLSNPRHQPISPTAAEFCFDIIHQDKIFGELTIYFQNNPPKNKDALLLLQAIADNIAAALSADRRHGQEQRLTLMEERAVIARELHDSLAQSLSYLKIQISRLQILQKKNDSAEAINDTISHIKTGISAAYTQLRELLTTFRLQLSSGGLHVALVQTVEEFSSRSNIDISLDFQLANFPLTPNEEIHILQIVRESLSNVLRHSQANNAEVSIYTNVERQVNVEIKDDGIGFDTDAIALNHYGKIIIQERAQTLAGSISFTNQPSGGAMVILSFTPSIAKNKNIETRNTGEIT